MSNPPDDLRRDLEKARLAGDGQSAYAQGWDAGLGYALAALAARSEPEYDRIRRNMQDPAFRLENEPPAEGPADFRNRTVTMTGEQYEALVAAATPPAEGLLARWPEADLFAALDAEGWFRGLDTAEATAATRKVYERLAATPSAEGLDVRQERTRIAAAWTEAIETGEVMGIATANSVLLRILAEPYSFAPEQPE